MLQYWAGWQAVPLAAYITLFLALTALPNVFAVRAYGHVEYAASWCKILVGMCVPRDDKALVNGAGTIGSPFIIALRRGGQDGLAAAVNGFIS